MTGDDQVSRHDEYYEDLQQHQKLQRGIYLIHRDLGIRFTRGHSIRRVANLQVH